MKLLSLGFIFSADLSQVLLVHKNRPVWQAGLVNGVGGKVESGETTLDAMVRECQEETTLSIPAADWVSVATINEGNTGEPGVTVDIFAARHLGDPADATKNDHEDIEWFEINSLPDNVIQNLHFLVPMAREHLNGHESRSITIQY